jgi:eukaryotic-like serine/threonine-protein kinase
MKFLRFLFSLTFLKHLLIAAALTALIIWGVLFFLARYTGHNKYIAVPDLRGKLYTEVASNPQYGDFRFVVLDSVFNMELPRGTIIYQDPWFDSRVKKNRQIYVTLTSATPDEVEMPDLRYLTVRQAESMLESYGLKTGKHIAAPAFDADAVQEQIFEGEPILPGTRIYKGSVIDLVVGTGKVSYEILIDEPIDGSDTIPGYEIDDYIDF